MQTRSDAGMPVQSAGLPIDRGTLNGSEADEAERHLVRERCDGLGDIDCLRQYTDG